MADLSNNVSLRPRKTQKVRACRDQLQYVQIPLAIRKMSETIDNNSTQLEVQIRTFIESEDAIGDGQEVSLYVDQ